MTGPRRGPAPAAPADEGGWRGPALMVTGVLLGVLMLVAAAILVVRTPYHADQELLHWPAVSDRVPGEVGPFPATTEPP
ncbi:hypothetical protein E1267_40930, partial [Nonomuraea longispora]